MIYEAIREATEELATAVSDKAVATVLSRLTCKWPWGPNSVQAQDYDAAAHRAGERVAAARDKLDAALRELIK